MSQAGVDLLMRSESNLRTQEEFLACLRTVQSLELDALILVTARAERIGRTESIARTDFGGRKPLGEG